MRIVDSIFTCPVLKWMEHSQDPSFKSKLQSLSVLLTLAEVIVFSFRTNVLVLKANKPVIFMACIPTLLALMLCMPSVLVELCSPELCSQSCSQPGPRLLKASPLLQIAEWHQLVIFS